LFFAYNAARVGTAAEAGVILQETTGEQRKLYTCLFLQYVVWGEI
jgi:hypothetical protein